MLFRVFLLSLLTVAAAGAQDWATLTPSIGPGVRVADRYAPDWQASPGLAARVTSPAYGGRVRAALDRRIYEAQTEDLPGFAMTWASVGWGAEARLPGGATLGGGVLVGGLHLRFDDVEVGEDEFQNVTETEAMVGGWGRLSLPVWRRVHLWAEAEILRVALTDPAAIATASGGVALQLDTPAWLREVLR